VASDKVADLEATDLDLIANVSRRSLLIEPGEQKLEISCPFRNGIAVEYAGTEYCAGLKE
jgi:hypothetical protein